MKVNGFTASTLTPAPVLANSGCDGEAQEAAAAAAEGADRRLHRPRGQRPHPAAVAQRRHDRQDRRAAGRRRGLAGGRLAAALGGAVRAAGGALGDRRPAARRPEDAARPLPDGRRRDPALGAADDRPSTSSATSPSWRASAWPSELRIDDAPLDPAGGDRAARQPLLGPRRPARQRHRLAGRSGLRRRGLARRSTRRSARACSSAPAPTVTAVAQDARGQSRNRELALRGWREKIAAGLRGAAPPPADQADQGLAHRRLEQKRRIGERKRGRRRPGGEDGVATCR